MRYRVVMGYLLDVRDWHFGLSFNSLPDDDF